MEDSTHVAKFFIHILPETGLPPGDARARHVPGGPGGPCAPVCPGSPYNITIQ